MTTPDLIPMFATVLDHTAKVVSAVEPSQRSLPTPCTEWQVEQLLDHMVGTLRAAVAIAEGSTPQYDPTNPPPVIGDHPVAVFGAAADAALATYRQPGLLAKEIDSPAGRLPASQFLHFPMMDMWVHSWDLAKATGQTVDFDDAITGYMLGFCQQAFGQQRPPEHVIGPAVVVPESAPLIDQLVGFTGRQP